MGTLFCISWVFLLVLILFFFLRMPFWHQGKDFTEVGFVYWTSFWYNLYCSIPSFLPLITPFLSLMNYLINLSLKTTLLAFATEFQWHSFWGNNIFSDVFSGHSLYHLFLYKPEGIDPKLWFIANYTASLHHLCSRDPEHKTQWVKILVC